MTFRASIFSITLLLIASGFASCNSVIETTKTVKMSRADERMLDPTEEERLGELIIGRPLAEWNAKDIFLATDEKISLIFRESVPEGETLRGAELCYNGLIKRTNPDGRTEFDIEFQDSRGRKYAYPTGKGSESEVSSMLSTELPMLLDPLIASKADSLLRGKHVWIRSQLWYDPVSEEAINGKKYVGVTITGISPGNTLFPLKVNFETANREKYFLWMSTGGIKSGSTRYGSRPLPSLLSLSDPKEKHPEISKEIWGLICEGKVTEGMTKAECRLSLGSPSEVNSGHDWNATLDIWQYPDGRCLQFRDGLLVATKLI